MPRLSIGALSPCVGQKPPVTGNIISTGAIQRIPTWETDTGRLNKGHYVYLPPSYASGSDFKLAVICRGRGSTELSFAVSTNDTWVDAMTATQIPDMVVLYVRISDPRDMQDSWACPCYDGFDPMAIIQDVIDWAIAHAKVSSWVGQRVMVGFSMGAHVTLKDRATYGASRFIAHAMLGAPNGNADLGGAASIYSDFTAAEKAKLFNSDSANCQAQAPFASTAGTALFNVHGAGSGALLMAKSDPADGLVTPSMVDMMDTQMPALGIQFTALNLDDATHSPTHNASLYFDAWFEQATTNLSWLIDQMTTQPTATSGSRARLRSRVRGRR